MYLVMTCGELLLSSVDLSVMTKFTPRAFTSQTMRLWFPATAAGSGVGAIVVRSYGAGNAVAYFGGLGAVAIGLGVALVAAAETTHRDARRRLTDSPR